MVNVVTEKACCGCAACSAICPKHAIHMEEGSLGHLFPKIEESLCVQCGLCEKVCPMQQQTPMRSFQQKAFVAYSKDARVRFNGSSGGMFETFARKFQTEGYVVYGAAFDAALQLKCTAARTESELLPLTKSKYLQADISKQFPIIQEQLKTGEKVFITATPCYITALKSFLGKEYENLITVDFFCHGVPSQKFFNECLAYDAQEKYNGEITNYAFRAKKKNGATPHYCSISYRRNGKNSQKTGLYFDSTFYAFFQKYICLRESCYDCQFAGQERFSDITIGDFHDVDNYVSGINRFDGVSTVIINTEKGNALFQDCLDTLHVKEIELQKLISDKVCFAGGTQRPSNRDLFVKDYNSLTIKQLANKYVAPRAYWKMRIYYALPSAVRKRLKKIMGV